MLLRIQNLMTAAALLSLPAMAQTTYRAPRAPGGHPDLNGIWQTMNEANYDLEGHSARPAMVEMVPSAETRRTWLP